jgi:hypothetical protein
MYNARVERWLSGRKRFPAKEVYLLSGIEGSNPSLSDRFGGPIF